MQLLLGKIVADQIFEKTAKHVKELRAKKMTPHLAVVLVGRNPASAQYVKIKKATAEEIGIEAAVHRLPVNTSEKKVLALIDKLNKDKKVTGILVQMPLPSHIAKEKVVWALDPKKDVDGFQLRFFEPPAPKAILEILRFYNFAIARRKMLIIGQGFLVGRPLSVLAKKYGATVTVIDSNTTNLEKLLRDHEIVVAATGVPKLIKAKMVSERHVIVDAGSGSVNGDVHGDVDFKNVSKIVKAITPVPGGVGPVTVAILLANVVRAARMQEGR